MRHTAITLFLGLVCLVLSSCGGGSGNLMNDQSCPACLSPIDMRPFEEFRALLTGTKEIDTRYDTMQIRVGESFYESSQGPIVSTLGWWAINNSPHVRTGDFFRDGVVAGVTADENGIKRAYAVGPEPVPFTFDTAIYQGNLDGISENRHVTGEAEMSVDLQTLTGMLNLTNLEINSHDVTVPGSRLTTLDWTQFLDGDLSYMLAIEGDTFRGSSGDHGVVLGSFFGDRHIGGTLQRDDLDAAFTGVRP